MICIKCGHNNPDALNYCEKCNAYIFKMATGAPTSSSMMELEEGREYMVPQKQYVTEHLYNLTCRAYEYVHQEGPGEPLLEAYEVVKTRLDELEGSSLPSMLEQLQHERLEDPKDEYPSQVIYLLNKGVSIYREGCTLMDQFIESGDTTTLIDAITQMQEGNDNLGLALEMGQMREQLIQDELNRREAAERAAAAGGASPGGTAEGRVRGSSTGSIAAVDKSDVG